MVDVHNVNYVRRKRRKEKGWKRIVAKFTYGKREKGGASLRPHVTSNALRSYFGVREDCKQWHEEKLFEGNGSAEKYGFTLARSGCELV